jgi:hypothetical protein
LIMVTLMLANSAHSAQCLLLWWVSGDHSSF